MCSPVDLGNNAEEWERRGNLVKTHWYSDDPPKWGEEINQYYNPAYDQNENPFSFSVATEDIKASDQKGNLYYACVVHFADGNSAISDVKNIYKF